MSNDSAATGKGSPRIAWLDVAKGIGVLLVLFGHLFRYGGRPSTIIFSFHMPLFFIIAGMFFKPEKAGSFDDFIKSRAKRLLVPYALFCALGFLLTMLIPSWRTGFSFEEAIWQTFYLASPEMLHVGQVWFLFGLFWAEIAAYILYHAVLKKNPWWVNLSALIFIAYIGFHIQPIDALIYVQGRAPLKFDSAITATVLYVSGYYMRSLGVIDRIQSARRIALVALALACLAFISFVSVKWLGWVNISSLLYNNIVLYYACAFAGTLGTLAVASVLERLSILRTLGEESLLLFSIHSIFLYLLMESASAHYGYPINIGVNPPHAVVLAGGVAISVVLIMVAYIAKWARSRVLALCDTLQGRGRQ